LVEAGVSLVQWSSRLWRIVIAVSLRWARRVGNRVEVTSCNRDIFTTPRPTFGRVSAILCSRIRTGLFSHGRQRRQKVALPHPASIRIMPIRSLLAETSFDPEQTEMIAKAFDDAWTQLQSDEDEPAMASLVRTALAKRIIEMAHRPGVDVQKLRDDAIAYVKNNPLWPSLWRAPS
jgi:hypothetical protein